MYKRQVLLDACMLGWCAVGRVRVRVLCIADFVRLLVLRLRCGLSGVFLVFECFFLFAVLMRYVRDTSSGPESRWEFSPMGPTGRRGIGVRDREPGRARARGASK